jgi:hypothetical protein
METKKIVKKKKEIEQKNALPVPNSCCCMNLAGGRKVTGSETLNSVA